MKILSYKDRGVIALKLGSTIIEANKKVGRYDSHKFESDSIMVISIENYGDASTYVTFFDPTKNVVSNVNIPNDFQVTMLRGKALKDLKTKYDEFTIKNFRRAVPLGKPMLGSDPEIFAQDANGRVVPAFDFLGSQKNPDRAELKTYGNNKLYWDGFQAEFDTTPNHCLAWHVDSVQNGLKGIYDKLMKHSPTAQLSHKPTIDIPHTMLESAKEEHVEFGCMPSQNIYGMEGIKESGRNVPFRSAGGHIHFGMNGGTPNKATLERMIKALDAVLGVACVSLFAGYDDARRRSMYGLAGEYRTPKHGFEYRTLSNAWLMHPLLMNIVFDLSRVAVKLGEANMLHLWKCDEKEVVRIINTCDVTAARKVLKQNDTLLRSMLSYIYGQGDTLATQKVDTSVRLFNDGVDVHIEEPTNIVKNWNLNGTWVTHSNGTGKNLESSVATICVMKRKVA